eukprot:4029017-Pyramimonas_sp.AAC.1
MAAVLEGDSTVLHVAANGDTWTLKDQLAFKPNDFMVVPPEAFTTDLLFVDYDQVPVDRGLWAVLHADDWEMLGDTCICVPKLSDRVAFYGWSARAKYIAVSQGAHLATSAPQQAFVVAGTAGFRGVRFECAGYNLYAQNYAPPTRLWRRGGFPKMAEMAPLHTALHRDALVVMMGWLLGNYRLASQPEYKVGAITAATAAVDFAYIDDEEEAGPAARHAITLQRVFGTDDKNQGHSGTPTTSARGAAATACTAALRGERGEKERKELLKLEDGLGMNVKAVSHPVDSR